MSKQYPAYPSPHNNPHRGQSPKLPVPELLEIYDELTSLGLDVLPKLRDRKFPAPAFWGKDTNPDTSREAIEEAQRKPEVSGWCVRTGGDARLYVLDFDTTDILKNGEDPERLYHKVQSMSQTGFVLRSPANGVHLYYRIPPDKELLGNQSPPVKGIDARGEGGQVVTLGGFNVYEGDYADKKGVVDGHTATYVKLPFGDYSRVPEMSDELYEWLTSEPEETTPVRTSRHIQGENYGKTEAGQARVEKHHTQPETEKESIVLECLKYILDGWDERKTYEDWLQVWMGAYSGSDGSYRVRDYILSHENVIWSDGQAGRRHFRAAWNHHEPNPEGFTVASIFWLARQNGWLSETGYEIPESLTHNVNFRYVSEWVDTLDEIPTRLALRSQTGTGKTYNIRSLWEKTGKQKTVIFVPTIKLATELSYTLLKEHDMPVTLYINDTTGEIQELDVMTEARVLVTTLQTFGTKVYPHVNMRDYGLVYVEESDQLLAQFSRGGGGMYSSHVAEHEARAGFDALREAMEDSAYVWFVDATMTRITYHAMEAMRDTHDTIVVNNTRIKKKPEVTMLTERSHAFQEVLIALDADKSVVAPCDTKSTAKEVYQAMLSIGAVRDHEAILITADTKHRPEVVEFMKDVNDAAPKYKLVAYSPVMASGVSITSFRPDVIVQFCRWLTPRNNLQILNRYRKQKKVFCYYQGGESLYAEDDSQLLQEARERIKLESGAVGVPLVDRRSNAELRASLSSISLADEFRQKRSAREFYMKLLEGDGRAIHYSAGNPPTTRLKHTLKGVRRARKAQKERISKNWQNFRIVDRDNPPDAEMTDFEVACGEAHGYISRCLFGNIPEDIDPEYVYKVVDSLGSYGYYLDAFTKQTDTLKRAEAYLVDADRAITSVANNVTMINVVALAQYMFHGLKDDLSPADVAERSGAFLEELRKHQEDYDAMIPRGRQKYETVEAKNPDPEERALAFCKIILSKIGLKQRSYLHDRQGGEPTYHYRIRNARQVIDFLTWRNGEVNIEFSTDEIEQKIKGRANANRIFQGMDESGQQEVFRVMSAEQYTDFKEAVLAVHNRRKDRLNNW